MMDITTLAAAKAYTDKKVAEGGESGGGGVTIPVVKITTAFPPEGPSGELNEADSSALTAAFDSVIDSGTPVKIILPQSSTINAFAYATPTAVTLKDNFMVKNLCFFWGNRMYSQFFHNSGGDYWEAETSVV
jgi:hypothetical protein